MLRLPAGRLLLAFSGGPDSTGLAAALRGRDVVLGYCDHRLRGERASRRERASVERAAAALGMPLVRTRLALRGSGEREAREARFRALIRLARRERCAAILLAHTADDRAETILLHLLRGAGIRGLAGMPAKSRRSGSLLLRPALGWRRAELRAHATGIGVVDDGSNRSSRYGRARIRGLLLPAIAARLGEDPVPLLCALGDAARVVRARVEQAESACGARPVPAPLLASRVERLRRAAGVVGPSLGAAHYLAIASLLAGGGAAGAAMRGPRGETWARAPDGALRVTSGPS